MSFQAPLYLLGLVLVPLAIVAYVRFQRRRHLGAEPFADAAMLPSVVPQRPGWRRHAPMLVYAIALAGLIVALARPQATVAVAVERASIILTTDYSGSMQARDVPPNRLVAARRAAERFLEEVPDEIQIGAVAFNHGARTLQTPTTDRERVRAALTTLRPRGGTATGDGLAASLAVLRRERTPAGRRAPAAVVLISDGASTRGRDPIAVAQEARRLGVRVYTVALGTASGTIEVRSSSGDTTRRRVPPDPDTLRQMATITRGQAFAAADASALSTVYERLGSQVGRRDETREITAGFAGGALVLMGAGALMSLRWFRRVP